jgi:uncharacterized protein
VNPLYLGTARRRIFGIHEPPAATGGKARAAVLCYPWDIEYTYAHRSMRQLAARLSMCGFHTLRFDYFGTGDSDGEMSQTDLAGCEVDLEAAIETVKDIAATSQVALIGLRAGANIAARVAQRLPGEVEALVLWDPIVSFADTSDSRVLSDLRACDLAAAFGALPERALMLVTQRFEAHEHLTTDPGRPLPVEFVTAPCPWTESATISGALPVQVIQRIEAWLR